MNKISVKIILLVLVALIVLGAAYYFLNQQKEAVLDETNNGQEEGLTENSNQETQAEKDAKITEAIAYTEQNIAQLSPTEPVLGGSWYVLRFWFADENNFYVEYEDGHILRQILVNRAGDDYKVVGYFEPGENAFELKEGQDTLFGQDVTLYEKNQTTGQWEPTR